MMARRAAQALEAVVVHRWCRQSGIDHVHAHFGGAPGTVAWFAAALSRRIDPRRPLSWSITIHGPHDFMNERSANLPALVANADLVVAISDFTAAQLLRLAPPSRRNRVQVVRCGIDLQLFAERDPSVDHRVTDEGPDSCTPLRVVTIGRMAPEKGQWVLCDAIAQLADRGVDVTLRIVGDGELRDELVRQIDALGLTDRIELVGLLEPIAVRAEIAAADVFCLPSFAEGLPIALMEAAAVGTPIVCTSVAGIPELVIDGQSGRCVPAGSMTALAAAIEQLAVDPQVRRKLADGARAMVEARHERRTNTRTLATLLRAAATNDERSAP
jgi:glycosyltransferase involved in cell wall biosynthesis